MNEFNADAVSSFLQITEAPGIVKSEPLDETNLTGRIGLVPALPASHSASKFACTYDGCNFEPKPSVKNPRVSLRQYVVSIHEWKAKPCPHGCDPEKLYTKPGYGDHLDRKHSTRFPASCRFPGCSWPKTFAQLKTLKNHIQKEHGLEDRAMVPYIPAFEVRRKRASTGEEVQDALDIEVAPSCKKTKVTSKED